MSLKLNLLFSVTADLIKKYISSDNLNMLFTMSKHMKYICKDNLYNILVPNFVDKQIMI